MVFGPSRFSGSAPNSLFAKILDPPLLRLILRSMPHRNPPWPVLAVLIFGFFMGDLAHAGQPQVATSRWHCRATENFLTYATDASLAQRIAERCEIERGRLFKLWLGESHEGAWSKCRCVVVVHPTAPLYAAAVGRGGEQSTGCSTTRFNDGKIVYRRIDLRADRGDPLTAALPHELTHVVLADRFLDRPLPRWADEGMAILSDPPQKQSGHARDAQLAALSTRRFSAADLLGMVDYPTLDRQPTFYGQSASLVKFLVKRGGNTKFLDFVELSTAENPDQALQSIYHIQGAAELERLWLSDAAETLVASD